MMMEGVGLDWAAAAAAATKPSRRAANVAIRIS